MAETHVTSLIREGILVEVIHESMAEANPRLYRQLLEGGGALAGRLPNPLDHPDLEYPDQQVAVLRSLLEQLPRLEREAVIVHELTHIRKGHLTQGDGSGQTLVLNELQNELEADQAAVDAVSAQVTLSALLNVERISVKTLLKLKSDRLAWFLGYISRHSIMRKRVKVLKAMAREERRAGK